MSSGRDREGNIDSEAPQFIEDNDSAQFSSHPPLSPATPAESFFLSQLKTSDISAFALAAQIKREHSINRAGSSKVSSRSGVSVTTDEFASACESHYTSEDSLEDISFEEGYTNTSPKRAPNSLFGRDVLVVSRQVIHEEVSSEEDDIPETVKMSKNAKVSTTTPTAHPPAPTPTTLPAPTKKEAEHYDVTQHVYEGAKGVWAFGKKVFLVKTFLGVAEGVTSKAVGVTTGKDLGAVDRQIKPQLAGIDNAVLNPAIAKVWQIIGPAVRKGDSMVRPIILAILGPFRPMIEGKKKGTTVDIKKKNEKDSLAPEVTKPTAIKT